MVFGRHSRKGAQSSGNLDFDARVPIPFSLFPSSYQSDAVPETTHRVEGEPVQFQGAPGAGREDSGVEYPIPAPPAQANQEVEADVPVVTEPHHQEEIFEEKEKFEEEHPSTPQPFHPFETKPRIAEEFHPYEEKPRVEYDPAVAANLPAPPAKTISNQLDVTERDYRRRTHKDYDFTPEFQPPQPGQENFSAHRPTREVLPEAPRQTSLVPTQKPSYEANSSVSRAPSKATVRMGYYDDSGDYHSFRRGVQRAADHILHPSSHHHKHDSEVVVADQMVTSPETVRAVEAPRRGQAGGTVSIPCHFIRVGDVLILQGRPCQVIRITTSAQTGQHRYLGVDLFTRQLHEESSFVSNPKPSVVVQSMLGPVYKTYRILDIREDGRLVAMTESGDVIQDLAVLEQGGLYERISGAFAEGRGSVRALVINDGGRELAVDYKVIHGSRL
ncbi:hypothetical protein KEM55_002419 [Ascosphaera atra]|nr:hypothetical protein KEM55_002419 [Ascosphaera atra]